ncbi:MAG: hypothetical protein VB142_09635 [Burkholderia sp.]
MHDYRRSRANRLIYHPLEIQKRPYFKTRLPEATRTAFHRSLDFDQGSFAFDAADCERFLFGDG